MMLIESILTEALCIQGGRIYGSVGTDRTDCVRLTGDTLEAVYGAPAKAIRPQLLIHKGQGPWSPIAGAVAAGLGEEVSAPIPGRVHLCQGWARLTDDGQIPVSDGRFNGHGWFWYEPPTPSGKAGLIIQATPADPPWNYRQRWDRQIAKFAAGVRLVALYEVA